MRAGSANRGNGAAAGDALLQDTRNAYLRLVPEGRVIMYSCGRNSFYEFPPNERRRLPTTPRPDTPKDELVKAYREMEL